MAEQNIQLKKLKKGNRILLETKECVFDIEILSPEKAVIMISGGRRFLKPTEAVIIGVFGRRKVDDLDSLLAEKEIEKNIGIEIQYHDKDNITSDFVTSPVVSAKIYGETWGFEMWDANERNAKLEQSLEEARGRLRVSTKSSKEEEQGNHENPDV